MSIYLNITLHFHLIAINMHLSVWKHYIQFTRKYIFLQYIISIIIIFKSMVKCTSLSSKEHNKSIIILVHVIYSHYYNSPEAKWSLCDEQTEI